MTRFRAVGQDGQIVKHCGRIVPSRARTIQQRRPASRPLRDTSGSHRTNEGAAGLPTAAQKAEFRRVLKETRTRRRLSLRALGAVAGVSKSAVAQWENGRSLPIPAKVPGLERALEMEPGALSRMLGYLPITSGDDKTSLDVVEAIRRDVRLGEQGQELLITMYRQLLRQREQAASSH
jgi:transcriptional regulator with XRE-family HTH domain